jgi:hypothetical protein
MSDIPVISNFLTADKTGLVELLNTLAKEKIANEAKYKEIKKLPIKIGFNFNGLVETCSAWFSDDLEFKRLHFLFHSKHFTTRLNIFFDKDLNFGRTSFEVSKTGSSIRDVDWYNFGSILDEDIIKVLMATHTGQREVMQDLVPELHIEGAYDFASEEFKQRISLANMVLI